MKNKVISFCDTTAEWSLYLLIFCLPFAKAGVSIFAVLALIAWLGKRIAGFRSDGFKGLIPLTPLNRALAVFIIINIISVLFSANIRLSFEAFFTKTLKFSLIFFMVAETMNTEKRFKRLLWAMVFSAILITADAGVQYFTGVDFLKGYQAERLKASFSASNGFAGWLIVFMPVLWGACAMKKGEFFNWKMKVWLMILLVLLLICLIMTYTRGAWAGFFLGFVLIMCFFLKEKKLKYKAFFSLILIGLCGLSLLLWPLIKHTRIYLGNSESEVGETIEQRLILSGFAIREDLWAESLHIIKDFPFFGCGLNTYSILAPRYKVADWGGIYPHNSYLQMAAETGLLGLFAFFWILFSFFAMVIRYLNQHKDYLVLGFVAGILGFLFQAFFDTHLYSLQLVVLFWFMLGFTTAVIKVRTSEGC